MKQFIEALWDSKATPYDTALWDKIEAPWELLKEANFKPIFEFASNRPGIRPLPLENLAGQITKQDWVVVDGKLTSGWVEVIDAANCTKGKMKVRIDGKAVEGASWIQPGVYFAKGSGPIHIGSGCLIQAGAYLEGPLVLGTNCEVRQGAFIRGQVVAGHRCIIGHSTEIKNTIMHDGAKAPHFAYIGDSILGAEVNLGAGTKVSNLKITSDEIKIPYNGERLSTGMRKLGGILGDHVETGCNCVLNPGTILARHCMVYPAIAVNCGFYPPKSWLRGARNGTSSREG